MRALQPYAGGHEVEASPHRLDDRQPILAGLAVIALFVGGFGSWAMLAPLSSAAIAPGQVRVDSHRKTVQHMEGGIIRAILVHEGDLVQRGQLLVRIDDTQSAANLAAFRAQDDALQALAARLIAERDGLAEVRFPAAIAERCEDPNVRIICTGQEKIFSDRRRSLAGQIDIFKQRMDQLQSEIDGRRAQVASFEKQIALIEAQIKGVKPLVDMNLLPKPRLFALQQQQASLEGNRGEQIALIAKAEQGIGEAQLQADDAVNKQRTEVAGSLRDTQDKIADVEEKLRAARDVQHRTDVVAPHAGKIVNLRYFTPGAVVKPGDPILDIVPQNDTLIIDSQVRPLDIESVHPGLRAEIRLPAFRRRRMPIVNGTVTYVSADSLTNEHTGQSYYAAYVEIDPGELSRLDNVKLYPGMPAEVLINTGERTLLQYLLDPIRDSFARAFRER